MLSIERGVSGNVNVFDSLGNMEEDKSTFTEIRLATTLRQADWMQ